MKTQCSISAFFPCYNDAGTIASMVALADVTLRKTTSDYEIIVIDDGSSDSSNAPINPRGIYELSNLTAQKLFKIYNDNYGIRSITLRLTNIYGERAQMKHNRFRVANWFIRLAIDNETIKVFGDGSILRDFLHIDDTADAILMCALSEEAMGKFLT
ncbi:MAG: NAD-dependent epimerase/dehydratase family protein [Candidatus Aminicenantaceae bacterium]